MIVLPNSAMIDIIKANFIGSTPWVDVAVKLFKGDFTPSPAMTLAELDAIEADFDGYVAEVLTALFGNPYVNLAGKISMDAGTTADFNSSGGTTPNDIYGWYMTDDGGTVLIAAERFTGGPIPVAAAGVHIGVLVRLQDWFADGTGLVSF